MSQSRIPQKALLAWYDANRRDLPWRARPIDPYRIWLSEIMLQQTRVDTVLGYYARFLARFPTVTALADAPIDDVLALWAGLGYYARARNLHSAAKSIRDDHGGKFPSEPDAVRALKGIGDYTAGAILSMAFDQREALVDGNVIRVLARTNELAGNPKAGPLKKACWKIADEIVPAKRPGDFNQALMELGATVCLPANPKCEVCPIATDCLARAAGRQDELPEKAPRMKRPRRRVDCAYVERAGRVLLVRRPEEGLLGGLWEMPTRKAATTLGLAIGKRKRVATIEHAFSHFDLTLEAWACEATGEVSADPSARWVAREELASYGIGAAMKRALETAIRAGEA